MSDMIDKAQVIELIEYHVADDDDRMTLKAAIQTIPAALGTNDSAEDLKRTAQAVVTNWDGAGACQDKLIAALSDALTAQVKASQDDLNGMASEGRRMRGEYNIAADHLAKAEAERDALARIGGQ